MKSFRRRFKVTLKWLLMVTGGLTLFVIVVTIAAMMFLSKGSGTPIVQKAQQPQCSLDAGKLLSLINQERATLGSPQLSIDTDLSVSARTKLNDEVNGQYYGHNRVDGSSWSSFVDRNKIKGELSEDLSINVLTSDADWEGFKHSPSHYQSLTNPKYTRVGIAVECVSYKILHGTGPADNSSLVGTTAGSLTVVHLTTPQ